MARSRPARPWLCAVLLGLAPWAWAADPGPLTDDPGYVAFGGQAPFVDENLEIEVSVKDAMLQLVAGATREREPELASMIDSLRAIEVKVWSVPSAAASTVRTGIDALDGALQGNGWAPMITVRAKGSRGFVHLRNLDGAEQPVGLVALFLDGDERDGSTEVVFVNIIGPVDPAQVGSLAARFNIDALGERLLDGASE